LRAFNHYSFLWTAAITLVLILTLTRGKGRVAAAALAVVVFLAIFLVLRPGEPARAAGGPSLADIGTGQAVLLELFSPYCMACLAAKPAVAGLERDYRGRVTVLRVDIHSQAGAGAMAKYGLDVTPSFILFDGSGRQRLRKIGAPPSRAELDALLPPG
jgi:thiol-disulfide isomerase/thioredoxin